MTDRPTADGIPVYCAFDELAPAESIVGNPRNPNHHPEKQLVLLAKIIEAQGWRAPITVSNRSGFVVRGHGRLAAARLLGKSLVPVDRQDYTDEASEWADLIADNRIAELAELDMPTLKDLLEDIDSGAFDLELTGFGVAELETMMTATFDGLTVKEDEPPAVDEVHDPTTKPGDVWILGPHRLLCGDCTDAAQLALLMAGETCEAVITDPPYNVDYQGGMLVEEAVARHRRTDGRVIPNDAMTDDDFRAFLTAALGNSLSATTPGGAVYCCHAAMNVTAFHDALEAAGWKVSQQLIWVKQRFVLSRNDYNWQHEPILFGWRPGAPHRWTGPTNATTILEEDRPAASPEHPTIKPTRLIARFISNSTERGQLVLDPFGGSGTTLLAAGQLRRRCNMMEIDPRYCDVIVARWKRFTGLEAERIPAA